MPDTRPGPSAEATSEAGVSAGDRRLATWLLGLSIFATGFCGLVSEFLLSTVSSYILGNSIEQFSIIIALMMAMMGLAGALQRFAPDRRLVEQFIAVEILLALLGGFAPIAIYAGYGLLENHFLLVLYFFAGAIGFLIGFELPLVLRINASLGRLLPSNLAVILSLDYVGGFVGALVWTRFLLRELPLTEISFVIAGLNFAIASATFLYFTWPQASERGARRLPLLGLGAIAVVAGVLVLGFSQNRNWSFELEQRLYDERIVFSETTRYQRVVITHEAVTDDYRLFLNGNLQLSSRDEAIYHEQLVHPAMSLARQEGGVDRVLVLGGGDGLAVREVLLHRDVRSVTVVDLDPRMTELAADHPVLRRLNRGAFQDARVHVAPTPSPTPSPADGVRRPVFVETDRLDDAGLPEVQEVARVEILNLDADRFLDRIPGLWDVVLIDLPDPSSPELTKLYSREFYRKLRRVLAPGAIVALQATSPYHSREAFLCILRTLESAGFAVLPYQDDVPSFGSWGFVLASTGVEDADDLRRRAAAVVEFPEETRYLTPDVFRSALVFGKGELDSRNHEVNTLMRPVLLSLYLHESWLSD
jgi:spermidine synthase